MGPGNCVEGAGVGDVTGVGDTVGVGAVATVILALADFAPGAETVTVYVPAVRLLNTEMAW